MGEYKAPELEDLGSIAEFTAAFGGSAINDTAFDNDGEVIPNPEGFETGSQNGVFAPQT